MRIDCKEEVRQTLFAYPDSRDDIMLLIGLVWDNQLIDKDMDKSSCLKVLTSGYVSNPESIRRVNAILQNKHPHLRGKKWMDRKKHAKDVIEQIRNIEGEEDAR